MKKKLSKEEQDIINATATAFNLANLTRPKVVIALPTTGTVLALTTQSIGGSIIGANEAGLQVIDFIVRKSCEIASSRTWLVQEAIKAGATHLLFVDSDMVFPYDTIAKLLAHKKDIVGVHYNKRQFPLELVSKPLEKESDTELYQAQHAGTGLMLIGLKIFKKDWINPQTRNKTPWFSFGRDSQGALALGEDAWFCYSARDNGFETWIDPTIKVGHLGDYLY